MIDWNLYNRSLNEGGDQPQNRLFINITSVRRGSARWQHRLKAFAGT